MSDPTEKRWKDKSWRYFKADETNIERTFQRIRRQQKEAEAEKKPPANVKTLPKKGTKA